MKNIATIAIVLLASYIPARAQSYDTVTGPNGRLPGYHYTEWYDTCDAYFDTSHSPYSYPTHPWHGRIYEIFTVPLRVNGNYDPNTLTTPLPLPASEFGKPTHGLARPLILLGPISTILAYPNM